MVHERGVRECFRDELARLVNLRGSETQDGNSARGTVAFVGRCAVVEKLRSRSQRVEQRRGVVSGQFQLPRVRLQQLAVRCYDGGTVALDRAPR